MRQKVFQTIGFGNPPPRDRRNRRGAPSLAEHLDPMEMADASSLADAFLLLGKALAELPGRKEIVYTGWTSGARGPNYIRALRALQEARATVSVLDTVQADAHREENGLKHLAGSTGGTYRATYVTPGLAVASLARSFTGEYILSLDQDRVPAAGGELKVRVRGRPDLETVYLRLIFPPRPAGGSQ
jgi:hypothetical protein